jgi:hypothetical protein
MTGSLTGETSTDATPARKDFASSDPFEKAGDGDKDSITIAANPRNDDRTNGERLLSVFMHPVLFSSWSGDFALSITWHGQLIADSYALRLRDDPDNSNYLEGETDQYYPLTAGRLVANLKRTDRKVDSCGPNVVD